MLSGVVELKPPAVGWADSEDRRYVFRETTCVPCDVPGITEQCPGDSEVGQVGGTVSAVKGQGVFQKELETQSSRIGAYLHGDGMLGHNLIKH